MGIMTSPVHAAYRMIAKDGMPDFGKDHGATTSYTAVSTT
jgi:hypothetical protein